eukprot:4590231-Prymnesium_polylepis.1
MKLWRGRCSTTGKRRRGAVLGGARRRLPGTRDQLVNAAQQTRGEVCGLHNNDLEGGRVDRLEHLRLCSLDIEAQKYRLRRADPSHDLGERLAGHVDSCGCAPIAHNARMLSFPRPIEVGGETVDLRGHRPSS